MEPGPGLERLLSRGFLLAHPVDAARVLERFAPAEAAAALAEHAPPVASGALRHMAPASGAACLAAVPPALGAQMVAALPLDAAAHLVRRTEAGAAAALLAALPGEVAGPLEAILRHPEGTAGALADPRVLAVPDDLTAREAVRRVRRAPQRLFDYLYVVDRRHVLVGVLTLRELILAPPPEPLAAVMRTGVVRLAADAGPVAILAHPGWRDFHALPVVTPGDGFLGAIRYGTLRRLEREAEPGREAPPALTAVLAFGELCWGGLARVLSDLAAAAAPSPPAGATGREETPR